MKIAALDAPMKDVNIDAVIIDISEVREFNKDGQKNTVATLKLKDETGTCNLAIFNETIDTVKMGDKVLVRKAYCKKWYEEEECYDLTLGMYGKIIVANDETPEVIEEVVKDEIPGGRPCATN